jgi:hypothetical protein
MGGKLRTGILPRTRVDFTDTRSIGCSLRRVGVPYLVYASTPLIKKIYGLQCWRVLYYLCAAICQSRTHKILKKKSFRNGLRSAHLLVADIASFSSTLPASWNLTATVVYRGLVPSSYVSLEDKTV